MNKINQQMYALLAVAIMSVVVPVQAMGNQDEIFVQQEIAMNSSQESPVVWYKKRSTKVAAVAVTTAAIAYAIAVRMGKVASPVTLFTALFCAQVAKNSAGEISADDVQNKQEVPQESACQPVQQDNELDGLGIVDQTKALFAELKSAGSSAISSFDAGAFLRDKAQSFNRNDDLFVNQYK
jgi:hypothetical protein